MSVYTSFRKIRDEKQLLVWRVRNVARRAYMPHHICLSVRPHEALHKIYMSVNLLVNSVRTRNADTPRARFDVLTTMNIKSAAVRCTLAMHEPLGY